MVHRDELTQFIYKTLGRDLLKTAAKIDSVPNSVQIKGKPKVNKIALGVSLSEAFIDHAIKSQADYLIVHHGLHSDYFPRGRFDLVEDRLRLIFKHNLTLAGFHYALDAHPTLGNNAIILEKLGAIKLEEPYFDTWGWVGEFVSPTTPKDLISKAKKLFDHEVFAVLGGPQQIKRIGVCSGGGVPKSEWFDDIIDSRVDAHLTGEIKESVPYQCQAANVHYLACGHYATETFGVKALGEAIKAQFPNQIEVEFIDIPSVL